MRIIHTSDWHLGKMLDGCSRLEEQQEFADEFVDIVKKNNADMVIIAGDVYDTVNPPAKAESIFYDILNRISENGKRCIVVISGNHDSPERLVSPNPLARTQGIIILGLPGDYPQKAKFPGFEIVDSESGYFEVVIKGERAVILTLSYPSEKRLGEVIFESTDENDMQQSYSKRIKKYFDSLSGRFRDDTINIAVSHLYVNGGVETDSERPIQIGGSLAVDACDLPHMAQYIALGHLHNIQKISDNVFYAGSPIQYSKSEANQFKGCYLVDIRPNEKPKCEVIKFRNYKPIDVWKLDSIEDAIQKCKDNSGRRSWVYMEIKTDRVITQSELKEMHDYKDDIIEIRPVIEGLEYENKEFENIESRGMEELFKEFYQKETNTVPAEDVVNMFMKIVRGDEDEAQKSEDTGIE